MRIVLIGLALAAATAANPGPAGPGSEGLTAAALSLCGAGAGTGPAAVTEPPAVRVAGFGSTGFDPDTRDPEARAWFDQGVRLVWAFDDTEAVRAFQKAQALDAGCAMCAWGEAWARGPTINYAMRETQRAPARAALARAQRNMADVSPLNQALIRALAQRYAAGGDSGDRRFAERMTWLAERHRDNDAIVVLAADALMTDGPGNRARGSRQQRLLESVLRRTPDHTGAIHFYIHLTEWARQPALAEPYADRLGRLAPGASHLVHMPSHTYYWVGRYRDAGRVNVAAVEADKAYQQKAKLSAGVGRSPLHAHNIHFGVAGALMSGDGAAALALADHFTRVYAPAKDENPFRQVIRGSTWYAYGRHGELNAVLALPEPSADTPYLRLMRRYALGEAWARAGNAARVRAEIAAMREIRASAPFRTFVGRLRLAGDLAAIAEHVLEGRALLLEDKPGEAAAAFARGADIQDGGDMSSDPPPWWFPVRRAQGAALLKAGDIAGSRRVLEKSLVRRPHDPHALYALAEVERRLGRAAAAEQALRASRREWTGGAISLADA